MPPLPHVALGHVSVSRLIVGGNPFSGNSHFSAERDAAMVRYYTAARIKAALRECEAAGIDTFLGRADNHITRLLREYWDEGGTIQWIAQTAPERASVEANVQFAAAVGAKCCYLHGGQADATIAEGRVAELRRPIEVGRELGLAMGLAGHRPETLLAALEAGLPVQFLATCFYNLASGETYRPEDRDAMLERVVRRTDLPCIGYKIMAAGRNDPDEAFSYALSHLKPTDAICVGIYTEHHPTQVRDCVALLQRYGASAQDRRPACLRQEPVGPAASRSPGWSPPPPAVGGGRGEGPNARARPRP